MAGNFISSTQGLLAMLVVAMSVLPACTTATSTGQRLIFDGIRYRRADGDATVAPLPNADFAVHEIVSQFGQNGTLDQEQLQLLLNDVQAKCYSAEQLLDIHALTETKLKNDTVAALVEVCPTILYQTTTSKTCVPKNDGAHSDNGEMPPTTAQIWGYGILFVTIISCSALLGALILPCMKNEMYKMVLTYLVGLAVGTLSGNALIHLIPEAHNLKIDDLGTTVVWKNSTIALGIYIFFVVERVLKLISSRKDRKHEKKVEASREMQVTAMHDMNERHDMYKITSVEGAMGNNNMDASISEDGEKNLANCDVLENGHGHSHMPLMEEGKVRIAAVAYMIVFGDGLHNFVDGMAIGASLSISVLRGLSTSIAIICEELPHELGDFAILLKSGLTVKQAVVFNLLSALTCYAGLVVGILVGSLTSLEPYIFLLAAGMFLYISLVDMLPELNIVNEHEEFNLCRSLKIFFLQNAGLLTGYGIMIVLALYHDNLKLYSHDHH